MKKGLLKSVVEKGDELARELTRHNVFTKELTLQIEIRREESENNSAIDNLLKRHCINFHSKR